MTKVITRFLFVPICILLVFCKSPETDLTYRSETLQLIPVAENAYIHISYIALANGDRFACNGLVYINDRSAIVFDTPADRRTTTELIRWLTVSNPLNIEAVVVNHFHDDCLGGIEEFHERGVMSYASSRTLKNITDQRFKPNKSFEDRLTLKVGNRTVVNRYFGEAHSRDNIISYFPDEELLFGGCMIKALNAPKGNLNDANTEEWASTVRKIKSAYPDLEIIVPGHGKWGDITLLNYTIKLFSTH